MAHARRIINLEPEYKFILNCEDLEKGIEMMRKNSRKDDICLPPHGMYI